MHPHKKGASKNACSVYGAADRGRTDTVSLPQDFESSASANSTTAAYQTILIVYHNSAKRSSIFSKKFIFFQKILDRLKLKHYNTDIKY